MDALNEIMTLLKDGGWVAFAAFGTYLAYKLAIATIITTGIVKAIHKLVYIFSNASDTVQRVCQVAAAAGMRWPLTPEEWLELENRVRKDKLKSVA